MNSSHEFHLEIIMDFMHAKLKTAIPAEFLILMLSRGNCNKIPNANHKFPKSN